MAHNARQLLIIYYTPEEEFVGILRQKRMLGELQYALLNCTLARPNVIRMNEMHYLEFRLFSVRSED
jgi:hypothetical protein